MKTRARWIREMIFNAVGPPARIEDMIDYRLNQDPIEPCEKCGTPTTGRQKIMLSWGPRCPNCIRSVRV